MNFVKRFLYHLTAAATLLFAALAAGEWLVPGSVLPFFNLIDAAIPLIGLILLCAIVVPRDEIS